MMTFEVILRRHNADGTVIIMQHWSHAQTKFEWISRPDTCVVEHGSMLAGYTLEPHWIPMQIDEPSKL